MSNSPTAASEQRGPYFSAVEAAILNNEVPGALYASRWKPLKVEECEGNHSGNVIAVEADEINDVEAAIFRQLNIRPTSRNGGLRYADSGMSHLAIIVTQQEFEDHHAPRRVSRV